MRQRWTRALAAAARVGDAKGVALLIVADNNKPFNIYETLIAPRLMV